MILDLSGEIRYKEIIFPIVSARIENKFTPAEVEKELMEVCLPILKAYAGTDGRITVTGIMTIECKQKALGAHLECADELDVSIKKITMLVRAFRNWLVSGFNPSYDLYMTEKQKRTILKSYDYNLEDFETNEDSNKT